MKNNQIRLALIRLIHETIPHSSLTGVVAAVDTTNYTCDVEPSDGGVTYYSVRLKVSINAGDGEPITVPEVGSNVTISNLFSDPDVYYVSRVEKIETWHFKIQNGATVIFNKDGIQLNNGVYGGLVRIDKLKQQYDYDFTTLISAVSSALTAIDAALNALAPGSGISKQAFDNLALTITEFDKDAIENKTVIHGNTD